MLCNQLTAFTQQNAVQPDAVATFHSLATRMESAGGFGHPNSQIDDMIDDECSGELVAPLRHLPTEHQMQAERAFLATLDGSCRTPIAGLAELDGNRIRLRVEILHLDGSEVIAAEANADVADATELGHDLARQLLQKAPADLLSWR